MTATKNNSTDVINYLSNYYETFNSLPTNYITCNETGVSYTCFGTNLKKKIEKAGSIENLLTGFVGRGAKKKAVKADKTTGRTPAKVTIQTT
jgi:hypothetical protein